MVPLLIHLENQIKIENWEEKYQLGRCIKRVLIDNNFITKGIKDKLMMMQTHLRKELILLFRIPKINRIIQTNPHKKK